MYFVETGPIWKGILNFSASKGISNSFATMWGFPKIMVPHNGWWEIMENPIKMDELGGKPIIFGNTHVVGKPGP